MERVADLPHGRTLTVRPVTPDDVDALVVLYERLTTDDLHMRFFSAFRPSRTWIADWVTAQVERGHGIVAVVRAEDGEEWIAGDAGYVLLDDGSGELAITVEPDCRGWLGPYLLDALVSDAAERGVPALQAEILMENQRMLSLVRFRPYATIGHGDWTTVRVVIGTTRETPVWLGPHDRPRILVESAGGRWRTQEPAEAAGYHVMVCPGPRAGRRGRCPALEGRPCPLVEEADAVVVALPQERFGAELLRAHEQVHPGVPVCVTVAKDPETGEPVPLADDLTADVVTTSRYPKDLVAVLDHLTRGAAVSDASVGSGGTDAPSDHPRGAG